MFWYLFLAVSSLLLMGYTLWRKRDSTLVALYLFMGGLTYAFEYVILVLFNSYEYHPGVIKNAYFDNILGAVASDAFSIPAICTFVAAYRLGPVQMLLPIGILVGIELFFVQLGIYEHFWWNYAYTAAGLFVAFHIAKEWHKRINGPLSLAGRFITLYSVNLLFQASVVFVQVAIFHKYFYLVYWFEDLNRGHLAFATLYIFIRSFILVSMVVFNMDIPLVMVGLFIMSSFDLVLLRLNILYLGSGWLMWGFILVRLALLAALHLFNRFLPGQGGRCLR